MDVSSVYRRQDTMREICRRVGYQGRFVWLVSAPSVPILASKYTGNSRLRFRLLDITDPPPYSYKRFTAHETRPVKLDYNTALCALPTMRGRRRDLLVFMLCKRVRDASWSYAPSNKLSPEEIAVCLEQDSFDPSTMAVAHAVCLYRDLVDPRGRITKRGAAILDAKKLYRKV